MHENCITIINLKKQFKYLTHFCKREDAWVENQIDACTFIFYCRRQMGQKQEALFMRYLKALFMMSRVQKRAVK